MLLLFVVELLLLDDELAALLLWVPASGVVVALELLQAAPNAATRARPRILCMFSFMTNPPS